MLSFWLHLVAVTVSCSKEHECLAHPGGKLDGMQCNTVIRSPDDNRKDETQRHISNVSS